MFDPSQFDLQRSYQNAANQGKTRHPEFQKIWQTLESSSLDVHVIVMDRPAPRQGQTVYQARMIDPKHQKAYKDELTKTPLKDDLAEIFPAGSEDDVYVEINYFYEEGKGILEPGLGIVIHEFFHAFEYEQFRLQGKEKTAYADASYATTLKIMETEAVLLEILTNEISLASRVRADQVKRVKNLSDLISAYQNKCSLTDVDQRNIGRALNEVWTILKKNGYAEPTGIAKPRAIGIEDLIGLNALYGFPKIER